MSDRREKIIRSIRTVAVIVTGGVGVAILSLFVALLLRTSIARGEIVLVNLASSLLMCLFIGSVLIGLCCLTVFHALSFWCSRLLEKAVRLIEAMQMMGAQTHKERLETIRHYSLRIFKTKTELPPGVSEDVLCKEVSTFLSPMFYNTDRLNAIGSPYYCCDFEQIQDIINNNRAKWGDSEDRDDRSPADIAALERKNDDLQEKNKEIAQKYTAAAGRESQLKKRLEQVESHMAVLVELANKVSSDIRPPNSITEKQIKAKYLTIGKIHGITEAPGAYVDIFRKNMPKEIINWGGAPNQGVGKEETKAD
jgi:hypothetical protein